MRTGRGGVVPAIARSFRVALLQSRQFKVMQRDLAIAPSHVGSLHCTEVSQQTVEKGQLRQIHVVEDESAIPPIAPESLRCGNRRLGPILLKKSEYCISVQFF